MNQDNTSAASGIAKKFSISEMNENIKRCFIIKKDFSRSILPIYSQMHKIIGTIAKNNINYYVSDVITLSEKYNRVCINNIQGEFEPEFYTAAEITEISLKDYTDIEEFYLGAVSNLFKRMDNKIIEQLARKK